ncbi:uncharacterized protein LOC142320317 [Lycorma delicatula]|uniref:uncharacterized protein LOC142320317 n=1 Tax=Lycorma delicatula TaxID=130591 RepID=UPI003F50E3DB
MGPIRLLIITFFWIVLAERTGTENRTFTVVQNENSSNLTVKTSIYNRLSEHRFNFGHTNLTSNNNDNSEKNTIPKIPTKTSYSQTQNSPNFPLNDPRIFLLSENHHAHERTRTVDVHLTSSNSNNNNNNSNSKNNTETFPLLHRKHNFGVRNTTRISKNSKIKALKENISMYRNISMKQRVKNKVKMEENLNVSRNTSQNSSAHIQMQTHWKTNTLLKNNSSSEQDTVAVPSKQNSAPTSDEEYYTYAEYPDTSYNSSGYEEAGVLPEPDTGMQEEEEEVTVALPDDSLVDTDLHDHDLIDSVMYIYFGASERDQANPGRQVAAVGGVIALAAQLLTLASVARRLKLRPHDASALILLNAELALTLANLLFMVGIQATGDRGTCQRIAVSLHYLHLAACCWFFTNSLHIYLSLRSACYKPRVLLYCVTSWLLPIPVIMGSLGGRGYETRFYCWMSVERGMFISFMLPVSSLILGNTFLAVLGLRLAGDQDHARRALRVTVTVLPCFAVLWFLGVLALENSNSLLLPVIFITTNAFLNWFIFGWWLRGESGDDDDDEEEEEDLYEEMCRGLLKAQAQDDAWRRDADLQMDPICTISS